MTELGPGPSTHPQVPTLQPEKKALGPLPTARSGPTVPTEHAGLRPPQVPRHRAHPTSLAVGPPVSLLPALGLQSLPHKTRVPPRPRPATQLLHVQVAPGRPAMAQPQGRQTSSPSRLAGGDGGWSGTEQPPPAPCFLLAPPPHQQPPQRTLRSLCPFSKPHRPPRQGCHGQGAHPPRGGGLGKLGT